MLSGSEQWAPVSSYGKYELMVEVFTNYAPVTIGIIGFFIVLMLPFILGAKEKVLGKKEPPLKPAVKTAEDIKDEARAKTFQKSKQTLQEIEAILAKDDTVIANAKARGQKSAELAEDIKSPIIQAAAYKAIGKKYRALGDIFLAEKHLVRSYKIYKKCRAANDCAGIAQELTELYLEKGEPGDALDYARRAMLLFEQAELPDEAEKLTTLIKNIKLKI